MRALGRIRALGRAPPRASIGVLASRRLRIPRARHPMGRRKYPRHVDAPSLELSEDAMRDLLGRAGDLLVRHVASLPSQPTHAVKGGLGVAQSLKEPLPERGTPVPRLLRTLFGKAVPQSLNTASPGYLAYVPGGGLFQSAVAELIALATNRYTGIWLAAPALVQLEQNVIEWFCGILGLPPGSGGLLTSGGSMANLLGLVAARSDRLPPEFQKGVVYTSDQAHHSVLKAALFAGILPERVRSLPTDSMFRLDVAALEEAIERDVREGLSPFLVVASAGTTNTGAVDDLPAIARVARDRGLWLHVDAAYGGFFALTERGRRALAGIEQASSVTLDPHKGLFLPYGTGCLLVRDPAALRRACSVPASYMPPMQEEEGRVDFCEMGPELSREARGLRVWLPLRMHGASAFRAALDEKLDLAAAAEQAISAIPGIEIVARPQLSLFAFRYRPPGDADEASLEKLNRALLQRVNDRQRVFLSGARTGGRFFARVCVLSFRTHQDRIDALVEDVKAAVENSPQ
jgi:aromatic-L-amino-acid decarboxylase